MKRAFVLCLGICLFAVAAVAAEPPALEAGDRDRLDRAMAALTDKLALDARQAEAFRPLLAEHYADLRNARDAYAEWPAEEARAAFRQERQELRNALHQKLANVLEPRQLATFKRMQASNVNHAAAAREPD